MKVRARYIKKKYNYGRKSRDNLRVNEGKRKLGNRTKNMKIYE
jgi:hypothetical protein